MKIGLLGYGTVGTGVDLLGANQTNLSIAKILMISESECIDPRMTANYDEIVEDSSIDIIVECIGGLEPAHTFCKKALEHGKAVVTSNKAMMAHYYEELVLLSNKYHTPLCFEASVGGGIPWIVNMQLAKQIDSLTGFKGIFNGTTNYILDKMTIEDCSFGEALKQAQQKGYAEADPKNDLNGFDTANKVCLSANIAWDTVTHLEDFLWLGIENIDKKDILYAKQHNKVCKLIGQGSFEQGKYTLCVMPEFVDHKDSLSLIAQNNNGLELFSPSVGCLRFEGQGAGKLPTAHAIIQDCQSIVRNKVIPLSCQNEITLDDETLLKNYYLRCSDPSYFKDIAETYIENNILITKPISLHTLRNHIQESHDEHLFVAGVKL